jgi:2-dehydro-3-deoxyphosphogluconate aldolase/(4S)-4-hydroxy-2-oxoglutarate aldolase
MKVGVFCVGMGSKLFSKEKVEAEDWTYITMKSKDVLRYFTLNHE